ncbi:MAG: response regulator [Desulfobacteraceae bacterium]|nr:response regulator [Desulfobacteraceae bacterium]
MNNNQLKITPHYSTARIIVVEDEVLTADDICAGLEDVGYSVTSTVTSGEEAVKQAQEDRPDLILMDIVLSGKIDGIEAADQIRRHLNIPVIFLTSYADDNIVERAKISEPFGYILKPFKQRELHVSIYMALYKAKLEKELLKIRKLEATGILAGGIAHDFNNLLFVIMGNIYMAKDEIKPGDSTYDLLAEAEQTALRTKYLTGKFITFSTGGNLLKKFLMSNILLKKYWILHSAVPMCSANLNLMICYCRLKLIRAR